MVPPLPPDFVLVIDLCSEACTDAGGEGRGVAALEEYTEGVSWPFVDWGSKPRSNQFIPPRRPSPRSRAALRPKSISSPLFSCSICSGDINRDSRVAIDLRFGCTSTPESRATVAGASSVKSEVGEASVDDANTVFMIESHSSDLSAPKPSMRIGASSGGFSCTDPSPRDALSELVVWEYEDEKADIWFHSGEVERCDGRVAESRDVERTAEKSIPSSATSSAETPPHSSLRLRSMGVPRPAYLINGHEPRIVVPVRVAPRCSDDTFFLDFFWGKGGI